MLTRILEPEVMDSAEEARDYDSMDHRQVNERFVADFLAFVNQPARVLDVGAGTAQIPIELARRCPTVEVVAIDAAQQMIDLGKLNVERARLSDRIHLEVCDAKRLPFADAEFDALMSNSIVHHIPQPKQVIAEMRRVVRTGGVIFVRDLARPIDEATLRALVLQYAGDANAHQQKMFAESLHAALTVEEVRDIVAALGFPPDSVQMTSDRHWTWAVRRESGPPSS